MALEKHRSLPSRHSFDACSLIIITKIILDLTQVICPSIVRSTWRKYCGLPFCHRGCLAMYV